MVLASAVGAREALLSRSTKISRERKRDPLVQAAILVAKAFLPDENHISFGKECNILTEEQAESVVVEINRRPSATNESSGISRYDSPKRTALARKTGRSKSNHHADDSTQHVRKPGDLDVIVGPKGLVVYRKGNNTFRTRKMKYLQKCPLELRRKEVEALFRERRRFLVYDEQVGKYAIASRKRVREEIIRALKEQPTMDVEPSKAPLRTLPPRTKSIAKYIEETNTRTHPPTRRSLSSNGHGSSCLLGSSAGLDKASSQGDSTLHFSPFHAEPMVFPYVISSGFSTHHWRSPSSSVATLPSGISEILMEARMEMSVGAMEGICVGA